MRFWDQMDAAGHQLTAVSGLHAGYTTYCCEKCGALVIANMDGLQVFHAPPGNETTPEKCSRADLVIKDETSLKAKIQQRDEADYERLKQI